MTTFQGTAPKMLGRFISGMTLTGATKDPVTGVWTFSTTVTGDLHTGQNFGGFSYRLTNNLTDESPTDQFLTDMVPESGDFEVTITELRLSGSVPITEQIANGNFTGFRIQRSFLPTGATNPQVWLALCTFGNFDSGETERGPMRCVLTGQSAGVSPFLTSSGATLPF
jgi:hypothetical protein